MPWEVFFKWWLALLCVQRQRFLRMAVGRMEDIGEMISLRHA